jgi:hypothetical protein
MPRVCWEEQLCVSCEFVTKFAVYGFFAEHRVTHTHVLRPHFLGERQGRIKSGLRQFLLMRSNFQG